MGFVVLRSADLASARVMPAEPPPPALVILDRVLPDVDGRLSGAVPSVGDEGRGTYGPDRIVPRYRDQLARVLGGLERYRSGGA